MNIKIIIICLCLVPVVLCLSVLNKDDNKVSLHLTHKSILEFLNFFLGSLVKEYSEENSINFSKLKNDSFFKNNLKFIKGSIKDIGVSSMKEDERKSFFINIYNILVLESLVRLPDIPDSMKTLPDFEYQTSYQIGTRNYNLATIKHGVLRGNEADAKGRKNFLTENEEKKISLKKDPRIFGALFQPTKSSPFLISVSPSNLEETLNFVTHELCNKGVQIRNSSYIAINSLFEDHLEDFAASSDNLLRWLSKCVEDTDTKIALYFASIDKNFMTFDFEVFDQTIQTSLEKEREEKLPIEIYIESLCSDTHEFFKNQLHPSYDNLKKIIDLHIVTFGKASVTTSDDGKGIEFECQNGPLECTGNKILSCVVEYFETDIQIKLLTCLMSSPSIQNAIKECGRKIGVPVSAVEECYTSGEGSLILYQNGLRTLKLEPELFFVPTVTVNKKYNSSTVQTSIKHFSFFICNKYLETFGSQGIFTPSGCKVKLEIYFDSLNPAVHKFFTEQLTPTWKRVGDSLDLNIIPYGTTSVEDNDDEKLSSKVKCSRGPLECYGNVVMSCIVKLFPVETQVQVLTCMMKKKTPSFSGKECIEQEGEEWKPVDSCAEGEMGSGLMLENRRKTQSLSPRITSIPTVTVNGVNNLTFNEWAMHDLTALVCDAFILNAEEEGKITLPKGCPVRIELYIEMLCPDTKRFFLKLFYPAWKNLQSLIDLHLIPFGKANVWLSSNGKQYNFECQHGPLECKGNKILSCIVEYLPTDLQVEMIICTLESSSPSDAGKQCAEKLKLAWEPLEKCYTSAEGSEFLFQNGIRTMSLKPSFYFVPTVTVNKYYDSEQLQKSLTKFDEVVCEAYQEPFKRGSKVLTPKGCKLQIDLYFIGHSKESKDFFLNQLLTTWKKLNKFLTINLFPIGTIINKSRNEISFEESCRKDEICSSDLILSCVTKYFAIDDQLKFAECQLKTNSSSLLTSKKCAQKLGLSWDVVSKCFRSTESIKLLERNFMKTTHLRPTFHSVPTILFNEYYDKQELLKTRLNFQQTVCKSFYDPSTLEEWKPESCPVTIELFMASLCPDTKRFFLRQVKPTWDSLHSIIDLRIIPFGKASAKILNPDSKEYEFNCQHGPLECYGNKVMSCVVKHYSVNDQVQMIACMLGKEYPAIEGRECAEELGLDWEPIMDCFDTESSTLLYQNGLKTQNAKPKIFYIPTSIINGKYNKSIMRKSLRNLSGVVCSTYLKKMDPETKSDIPEGCKVPVKIFFNSLDDDMKRFFSEEAEEFWRIFRRIVSIKFLPLKLMSDKELTYDCSRNKCYRTKVLGCVMETQKSEIQMEFLACLMSQDSQESDLKDCSKELKLDFEEFHSCAQSEKGSKILEEFQENFLKLQNPAKKFPFILIKKTIVLNPNVMRKITCQNFAGPTPPECSLTSSLPS